MNGLAHTLPMLGAQKPSLRALQSWLLDVVTQPTGVSDGVIRAASNVPSLAKSDADTLIQGGRLPAADRLAIYRNGYFARLTECLADDYPNVLDALGEPAFDRLCKDFIERHPPLSASLNHYGAPFAAYCATRSEVWHGVIADLAHLEWALVVAIHADAESVLEAEDLASLTPLDWQHVRLRPSAALQVLAFEYPVNRYYQRRADGYSPRLPIRRRKNHLAVCRRGTELWRVRVDPALSQVLSALCAGRPLAQAIELVAASHQPRANHDAAAGEGVDSRVLLRLRAALSDWVRCGFFSGLM